MMRARSNTIDLEGRNWENPSKICRLCNLEIETIEHFLLDCNTLQSYRNNFLELQRPSIENKTEIIAYILLFEGDIDRNAEYYVDLIYKLYNERKKVLSSNN